MCSSDLVVGSTGPRGAADARFVGLTQDDGEFQAPVESGPLALVVVSADGGFAHVPTVNPNLANPTLQAVGRVYLDTTLRTAGGVDAFATVTFTRTDAPYETLQQPYVRFASAVNGWEIGDLPPGNYRLSIGSESRAVQVVPNGVVRAE